MLHFKAHHLNVSFKIRGQFYRSFSGQEKSIHKSMNLHYHRVNVIERYIHSLYQQQPIGLMEKSESILFVSHNLRLNSQFKNTSDLCFKVNYSFSNYHSKLNWQKHAFSSNFIH